MANSLEAPLNYPRRPAHVNRRGRWIVILNLFIPGISQLVAGNRTVARIGLFSTLCMWMGGVVALLIFFLNRQVMVEVFTNLTVLALVRWSLVIYAVIWIILTLDCLRLARLVRLNTVTRVSVVTLSLIPLLLSGGLVHASNMVASASVGLRGIFKNISPPVPPYKGRYNVMILGGDGDPTRDSVRPDSISLMSLDAKTGRRLSIGFPRDLTAVPFKPGTPMYKIYPRGFPANACDVSACELNTIYVEAQIRRPELWPDAARKNSTAGIEAMRQALEGITGMDIQYYVFVNMDAFTQLIDALGGINIDVKEKLPIGGDENLHGVVAWIKPGEQHMNGFTAQWYARSRHGTSDYDRMARQRQLTEAIIKQFNPASVLAKFESLAKAGPQLVKTDIPQSMLSYFVKALSATKNLAPLRLELVPPQVDPENPDYARIRKLIDQSLKEVQEPTPTSSPSSPRS